ncbi:UV excision repair protein [Venturia inaequalis]|nr:UV excision repair protein [Venturia inaequalis]
MSPTHLPATPAPSISKVESSPPIPTPLDHCLDVQQDSTINLLQLRSPLTLESNDDKLMFGREHAVSLRTPRMLCRTSGGKERKLVDVRVDEFRVRVRPVT